MVQIQKQNHVNFAELPALKFNVWFIVLLSVVMTLTQTRVRYVLSINVDDYKYIQPTATHKALFVGAEIVL